MMRRIVSLLLALVFAAAVTGCSAIEKLSAPPKYDVKFDPAGGELVSGELTQRIGSGEAAAAPEVKRDGYEFDGWDKPFSEISEDTTVTAKWVRLYTVTFDAGEGVVKGEAVQTLREGASPKMPTAEREGYTFDGWEGAGESQSGDVFYTAKWTRNALTAEQIYALVSPSVIEIHTVDVHGNGWQGSGFFIDTDGHAVTNFHVMEDARTAEALLPDGSTRVITGVVDYSEELDLCVVKVDISGNTALTISESPVVTGQTVYAIGSPRGYTATISSGIVSTASRIVSGMDCIQITAPISQGNSGGPLVNEFGEVIGVNTLTRTDAQNLNFSVNISQLSELDMTGFIPMDEFAGPVPEDFYSDYSRREIEPNGGYYIADALYDCVTFAGEIEDDNDEDWFLISVDKDSSVIIYIQTRSGNSALDYNFGYFNGTYSESNFVDIDLVFNILGGDDPIYYAYADLDADVNYYFILYAPDSAHDLPVYYAVEFDIQ